MSSATPVPQFARSPLPNAELEIQGKGKCTVIDFGSCELVLLLSLNPNDIATWTPGPDDIEFEKTAVSLTTMKVIGPPPNAPRTIRPGHWTLALAITHNTDSATPAPHGEVVCQTEFDVSPALVQILVKADFGPPCKIGTSRALWPPTSHAGLVAQGGVDGTDVVAQRA